MVKANSLMVSEAHVAEFLTIEEYLAVKAKTEEDSLAITNTAFALLNLFSLEPGVRLLLANGRVNSLQYLFDDFDC